MGGLPGEEQRAAVRRRARHEFRADAAIGARPVLHHHRHAGRGLELPGQQPREHVVRAARRIGHHDAQLLARHQGFEFGLRKRAATGAQKCRYDESMKNTREYGKAGLVGITVPQANTTVEAEFRALAPAGLSVVAARLQGSRSDSRQRLLDYFGGLEATLDTFDNAPLQAAGFACTGSSYLIGLDKDRAAFAGLSKRRGYPVVPATGAILDSLALLK